jgi:hypothetical protein
MAFMDDAPFETIYRFERRKGFNGMAGTFLTRVRVIKRLPPIAIGIWL